MTSENRQALKTLCKTVAVMGLVLAVIAGVLAYFLTTPIMQMFNMATLLIGAAVSGYRSAIVSPLWAGVAWRKGLLCLFAVLAGVTVAAASFSLGSIVYAVATGKTANPSGVSQRAPGFD